MKLHFVLILSILMQFLAAFLALRLIRVTRKTVAWIFIAGAIVLMGVRRCFTLYEWFLRDMVLQPVDIHTEIVGLATSILLVAGLGLIAPLFLEMKRSEETLKQRVEERTAQLKNTVQALELELSERLKTEEALRKSEERFRTVADFTHDWEYWLAPDGTYNYISPSCERITGYAATDFLKKPGFLEEIIHPEDRALISRHLSEDVLGNKAHSLDFRIITRTGEERWIAHVCRPVYSPDGANLGRRVSNRDVTQQKQAETEKVQLESQLRQAQKMEAIGRLSGGIAHDFNNILSPIIMYTEISLRATEGASPIRPYLEQVLKSSLRAADLVKQVLAVSRQTEQQRILMQVGPIIKEALKLLRASFPATIEIRPRLQAADDWVLADPTEIYQVVMNLCTNAAHALEENGGMIDVALERVDVVREELGYMGVIPPGAYVRLTVHDTGQGMAPEVMDRIFEPYFTTKEVGRGTGLGLAVVQGIVKACQGSVNVISRPEEGSTFQVYLPLAPMTKTLEPEALAAMPTGKEHILLVDDEADIVAATKILLQKMGYRVRGFTDPQEALAAFYAAPQNFNMVLADQTMPLLTGLELAEEILEVRPQMPIILCTGYSEESMVQRARELGVQEVLMKPLIPQRLAQIIRRVLDAPQEQPGGEKI